MLKKRLNKNKDSVYKCLGVNNHSLIKREENDYYATEPIAAKLLLEVEPVLDNIWECACGEGHLAEVFNELKILKRTSDLIDRGYNTFFKQLDFLSISECDNWNGDIVTNPPYKFAKEFVEKALSIVCNGRKVCMFLKLTFLEGKARKELFKQYPPKVIYVSSSRLICARNGDFKKYTNRAVAYAWFVWEKGYTGETIIKWIN